MCRYTDCEEGWDETEVELTIASCVEKRDNNRSDENPYLIATYIMMVPLKIYFIFIVYQYWMDARRWDRIDLFKRAKAKRLERTEQHSDSDSSKGRNERSN